MDITSIFPDMSGNQIINMITQPLLIKEPYHNENFTSIPTLIIFIPSMSVLLDKNKNNDD